MRTIGTLIHHELRRMIRAKETFWLLLFLPLLLIFILGNALAGFFDYEDRRVDPIEVGLVVLDEASAEFAGLLRTEEMARWLDVRDFDDRERMLDALRNREIGYGVVVPEHFAERATSGEEARWELYPGHNADANLVAESAIGGLLDRINFVQSAVIALGDPRAAEAAVRTASAADGSRVNVMPPDMSGRDYSALQYYAAQMLVMFLLYAGMAAGLSIIEDREMRTLERIHAAPVRPVHILAGKFAGDGLIAFAQALLIIVFTFAFYGLDWGSRYIHLLAVCLFIVISAVSLAVIVAALAPKGRTFQTVFMTLIMTMTFLSGGFTPELGGFLDRLGEFTLSYWASQSFIHLMLGSADSIVREHLTVLGLTAAGLFLISALLGRKAVSHE
jgi:ABC-2 type transport system permease protein